MRQYLLWNLPVCYYQNQVEKAKQDDALSDLSNILGDLKNMAVDMGSELHWSVILLLSLANYTFWQSLYVEASEWEN